MRQKTKWIEFIAIMFGVLFLLLVFNIIGLAVLHRGDYGAWQRLNECKNAFSIGENGYSFSKEGEAEIDSLNGFAFFIDAAGDVVWEYHMPEEIQRHFSLTEIASFSRWYLLDYPVFIQIMDDGLFVIGQPKGTVWKYMIKYDTNVVKTLLKAVPVIGIFDLFILIFVPTVLTKKLSKRKEVQRTEWIAGVSHDIRTPLSLVLGNASSLKVESRDEETKKMAATIESQALRMRQLVANLNTENKLSYGGGKWKQDKVFVASVLREIICDRMNQDENGLFHFSCKIDPALEDFEVLADDNLVNRMFENLINNAITHNPKGCEIKVSLKQYHKKRGVFVIEDQGIGASAGKIRELNKKVTTQSVPEHGLGLRVVKQIAEYYHWKIRFSAEEKAWFRCEIILK